jgi:hypothetical protein
MPSSSLRLFHRRLRSGKAFPFSPSLLCSRPLTLTSRGSQLEQPLRVKQPIRAADPPIASSDSATPARRLSRPERGVNACPCAGAPLVECVRVVTRVFSPSAHASLLARGGTIGRPGFGWPRWGRYFRECRITQVRRLCVWSGSVARRRHLCALDLFICVCIVYSIMARLDAPSTPFLAFVCLTPVYLHDFTMFVCVLKLLELER